MNLIKKGKYIATFLFLILCPLLLKDHILEPSNVPRFMAVVLIVGLVFLTMLLQAQAFYTMPLYLMFLMVGYYLLNLLSVSWSFNAADALYESQKIFLAPCVVILFLNWLRTNEEEELLVKSLILVTLTYCIYAGIEILQLPDLNFETLYAVNSFAEHKNLLSSFLYLLLTFPLYGVLFFKGNWKLVSGSVLVLTFSLILFLQTRSVYFALALGSLIFFLYSWRHLRIGRKNGMLMIGAVLIALILLMVFYPALFRRFNVFTYSESASGGERLNVWSKTFSLIKEHPLLGAGAGNWQYNYSKYGIGDIENVSRNDISFQRPHNDLLWILSETGIVGLSFIALVILFLFKRSYPELRSGNIKVILFFAILCGLLIESFFSFPKERISHIFLASVLLALLLKNLGLKTRVRDKSGSAIIVVILVVLVFSAILGFYRLRGEQYTVLLLQEKQKNNPEAVIKYGTKALSVFYSCDPTSTPIYSYLGWAYHSMHRMDSMFYVSKLAYELSPYDHEVLSNYGSALDRNGKRQEARTILKEALRINPFYEPALINFVVMEYNSKNYSAALDYLQQIPQYEAKYPVYLEKIKAKLHRLN